VKFFEFEPSRENIECFPSVSPWFELLRPSAMSEFEIVTFLIGVVPSAVLFTPV
jgi:hypothetical protein